MTADVKIKNINNRTYCFFNDMINIGDFHSSSLKIDKKPYKNIAIITLDTSQLKKNDDY